MNKIIIINMKVVDSASAKLDFRLTFSSFVWLSTGK